MEQLQPLTAPQLQFTPAMLYFYIQYMLCYFFHFQLCPNCNERCAIASKKCKGCGVAIPKRKRPVLKGDGNISHQKHHLFDRVSIDN